MRDTSARRAERVLPQIQISCQNRTMRYRSKRNDRDPLLLIEVWKLLAEMLDLGRIVNCDVWVVRVKRSVVLVIGLGCVEGVQRNDLRHDRSTKRSCLFKLGDVGLRDVLLFVIGVENHRAILAAGIRPLAIELRGVVSHGEEYFEKLTV